MLSGDLTVTVPDEAWEANSDSGDPEEILTGPTLVLNGSSFHVEAWAVDPESMIPINPGYVDDFEAYCSLRPGTPGTWERAGRTYVLVLIPFDS